jgi:hypothetical protein
MLAELRIVGGIRRGGEGGGGTGHLGSGYKYADKWNFRIGLLFEVLRRTLL